MRKISVDSARPGMILAKPILGGNGQVLLNTGVEIKPQYLTYLNKLGINHIYIRDSRIDDVEINDVISDKTRRKAQSQVMDIMNKAQAGVSKKKGLNINNNEVIQTVSQIMDEILESKNMIAQLQDIRTLNDYVFSHCVNCCVISTLVAVKMNYNRETLKKLAIGTLLHDLGMVAIPKNILNKQDTLTKEEYETIKKHPEYGYEFFKNTSLYSITAGSIILQHHERFQGHGYPQGLKGDNIPPLAQVAGVVDVYDALTSERPYRKAYHPHQAIEMLMAWGEKNFDLTILNYFFSCVAAYPLGTHVFLSNEESGLVIDNNSNLTFRPIIRVLYTGKDLAPHPAPYDLDLSQYLDLTIVKVLD